MATEMKDCFWCEHFQPDENAEECKPSDCVKGHRPRWYFRSHWDYGFMRRCNDHKPQKKSKERQT